MVLRPNTSFTTATTKQNLDDWCQHKHLRRTETARFKDEFTERNLLFEEGVDDCWMLRTDRAKREIASCIQKSRIKLKRQWHADRGEIPADALSINGMWSMKCKVCWKWGNHRNQSHHPVGEDRWCSLNVSNSVANLLSQQIGWKEK